jgi:hypothetical protein
MDKANNTLRKAKKSFQKTLKAQTTPEKEAALKELTKCIRALPVGPTIKSVKHSMKFGGRRSRTMRKNRSRK